MKRIFLALIITALILPCVSSAQSRAALKGNAYVVSDDNKLCGLEVNGKLVVEKKYLDFSTPDGKLFVVTAPSGKKGICNAAGTFIYSCNYEVASLTASHIMLKESKDSKPQFFSTANPKVSIQPKVLYWGQIVDEAEAKAPSGTYINPKRIAQRKATAQAAELSAKTGVLGSYQISDTPEGWQDLIVNDKVIFTASTFENTCSPDTWAERDNCWYFIVMKELSQIPKRVKYGVYCLQKRIEDGKVVTEGELIIPYEYDNIKQMSRYQVLCETWSPNKERKTFTLGKPTPEAPNKVRHVDYSFKLFSERGYQYATLSIKSVELHDGYTELKMSYTAVGTGMQIGDINLSSYYRLRIGDNIYNLTSWGGGLEPNMYINGGKTLDFDMRFEPLPAGATGFVLLTSSSDTDARRLVKFK